MYTHPAHPRSRGENHRRLTRRACASGSSPLTRGKRNDPMDTFVRSGLIPAHAGKTVPVLLRHPPGAAHPRSRGENRSRGERRGGHAGSSPLTRGKPIARRATRRARGLIPAHAGKTKIQQALSDMGAAHPRSRGENGSAASIISVRSGSSPLTRGKRRGVHTH